MKAVIFDLDQTLLDRTKSLQNFLLWQCEGMLRPYIENREAFITRFVELDANGKLWKDKVYSALIEEFHLEEWSCAELLSVYESCFCAFSTPRPGVLEALNEISPRFRRRACSPKISRRQPFIAGIGALSLRAKASRSLAEAINFGAT